MSGGGFGGRVRPWARGAAAMLAAGMTVLVGAGPAAAANSVTAAPSNSVTAAPTNAAPAGPGWTLEQGKRAVDSGVISAVPGATARVDTAAVTSAIAGSSIRVVMLPFAPLDETARHAAGAQGVDLQQWADDKGIDLIEVQGLQVSMSIFDVTPTSMAELAPMLAQQDVTNQVLFAVAHLRKRPDPPDPAAPRERPADPAEVAAIGDALATHRIYNAPDLATPQFLASGSDPAGPGLTVRAAFLPPGAPGSELPDLATPLHARFPKDLVVVVRGRYLEVRGPDQAVLDSALLWTYGYYQRGVLGWQVEPTALVELLAERVALLRTGVVTDQQSPSGATDPVKSVSHALPWVFAGIALALVIAVTGWSAFGRRADPGQPGPDHRRSTRDRRALGARLAAIAGQVVAIEPLAVEGAARADLSAALERYRVAGQVLASDGSMPVAIAAVTEAEHHLQRAAAAAGVPLASGGDA